MDYTLIILLKALSVPEYRVLDTRTDALIQVWDKALRNQNNLSFMGG
jgi:phage terminase large subunit-like protein